MYNMPQLFSRCPCLVIVAKEIVKTLTAPRIRRPTNMAGAGETVLRDISAMLTANIIREMAAVNSLIVRPLLI